MKKMKKSRAALIAVGLLVIVLIAGVLVWFFIFRQDYNDDDFFDPMAVTGILPCMSEGEIQSELDRVVEEGMLNISIASDISFEDGRTNGQANIWNIEANRYIFKVAIVLNDTGATLYESGGIQPGQYIQYIDLKEELPQGEHKATATFTAYTTEEHQIVGSAAAEITLYSKMADG